MQPFVRQPVLYPVSVVFVDDNPDFLQALRGAFPDERLNRFFTHPQAALDFVSSRDAEMPPTAADYFGAEKSGGNAIGEDALADPARFEAVGAVVVDYSMPEVDGIQFLTSIRNANCTKILLTGIADEREAVAAFNAGLIDCYLKKTDVEMARKLATVLDDAKRKCCAARGHISLHEAGATYRDPRIVKLIDEVAAREGIVEYYWRPNQDAVLMFDAVGAPSVFLAWSEEDWAFQCDIVSDAGGPAELRQGMEARRIMPLFWPFQAYRPGLADIRCAAPLPVPGWHGTFHSWIRLDDPAAERELPTLAKWRHA
ncbi:MULTISPECIES: response regulator [unclassified Burkholderia]|uniref:response regulator n=1 Tax=unclassified Burkholderia TaxID=2613784 RepID=UPI0014206DC6|nr:MULTISPECIES: response regulator [unclassified Burkholderia]NIE57661.1 response regulator [Burkholderia sp. Ap-955]NIF09997.1 response regulator [Burkholderia sp. Ax-1735]NIG03331.1 response regulator [Burkholderia sp. Tr-849]